MTWSTDGASTLRARLTFCCKPATFRRCAFSHSGDSAASLYQGGHLRGGGAVRKGASLYNRPHAAVSGALLTILGCAGEWVDLLGDIGQDGSECRGGVHQHSQEDLRQNSAGRVRCRERGRPHDSGCVLSRWDVGPHHLVVDGLCSKTASRLGSMQVEVELVRRARYESPPPPPI